MKQDSLKGSSCNIISQVSSKHVPYICTIDYIACIDIPIAFFHPVWIHKYQCCSCGQCKYPMVVSTC